MEKTHVNIIEEPIKTVSIKKESNKSIEKINPLTDKENKVPEPSVNIMTLSTITLNPTNDPSLDGSKKIKFFSSLLFNLFFLFNLGILEKINDIVKHIFSIKRSEKVIQRISFFFLLIYFFIFRHFF
jgi:hypothetical protein